MRFILPVILMIVLLCGGAPRVTAQSPQIEPTVIIADSFVFVALRKTPANPWYGIGSRDGYTVNGVEGAALLLERNTTYPLKADMPTRYHVLIGKDPRARDEFYGDIEPGNLITDTMTMYFTPREEDPDTLYYCDLGRGYAGGLIILVDSIETTSGVAPVTHTVEQGEHLEIFSLAPNPATDRVAIRFRNPMSSDVRLEIVNALGEVVLERSQWCGGGSISAFDVAIGELPPGPYFYRLTAVADGGERSVSGQLHIIR